MAKQSSVLRNIFGFFNVLFAIAGVAVIILAIILHVHVNVQELEHARGLVVVLYVFGFITLVISFLGAYGAFRQVKWMLVMFLVLMCFGCLILIFIAVVLAIFQQKDKISVCVCMNGYHCGSPPCDTCTQNRQCPPGYSVSKSATQHSDNECEKCPPGTFSDTNSSESSCQPWRECKAVKQEGTTTADRICGVEHIGLIIAIILVAVVAVIGTAATFICRGKCEDILAQKKKQFHNQCFEPLKDNKDVEIGSMEDTNHLHAGQEAEENEVNEPVQEREAGSNSIDIGTRSEGGQIVRQEQGKEDVLSQSESCPST